MAKKSTAIVGVTPDRARRLFRLLKMLASSAQSRTALAKKLRLNVRTFYRDLILLEEMGIRIDQKDGTYQLHGALAVALERLPFPDSALTLGEARQLARSKKSTGQQKIKAQIEFVEGV